MTTECALSCVHCTRLYSTSGEGRSNATVSNTALSQTREINIIWLCNNYPSPVTTGCGSRHAGLSLKMVRFSSDTDQNVPKRPSIAPLHFKDAKTAKSLNRFGRNCNACSPIPSRFQYRAQCSSSGAVLQIFLLELHCYETETEVV